MISKPLPTNNEDIGQRGISLLEVLIVLVIIGILAAVAIPSFTGANVQMQRQNVARQLKTFLDRARFDSIKRNAEVFEQMAKVTIHSSTSYSTSLDSNNNGTLESFETRLTTVPTGSDVKIVGDNLIFPITIAFNDRGQARVTNGSNAEITPRFVVCGKNCTYANSNAGNSNPLSISSAGAVALVDATQTFLNQPTPNVSSVGAGSKINPLAKVEN